MKRIALIAAVFAFILVLTKIANQVPPEPTPGYAFSLKAQKVYTCTPTEITLIDAHHKITPLEKDESWPSCESFQHDAVMDFYLSRGAKTRYLSTEQTVWWRKSL